MRRVVWGNRTIIMGAGWRALESNDRRGPKRVEQPHRLVGAREWLGARRQPSRAPFSRLGRYSSSNHSGRFQGDNTLPPCRLARLLPFSAPAIVCEKMRGPHSRAAGKRQARIKLACS